MKYEGFIPNRLGKGCVGKFVVCLVVMACIGPATALWWGVLLLAHQPLVLTMGWLLTVALSYGLNIWLVLQMLLGGLRRI